jgi:hypothetical protein
VAVLETKINAPFSIMKETLSHKACLHVKGGKTFCADIIAIWGTNTGPGTLSVMLCEMGCECDISSNFYVHFVFPWQPTLISFVLRINKV